MLKSGEKSNTIFSQGEGGGEGGRKKKIGGLRRSAWGGSGCWENYQGFFNIFSKLCILVQTFIDFLDFLFKTNPFLELQMGTYWKESI